MASSASTGQVALITGLIGLSFVFAWWFAKRVFGNLTNQAVLTNGVPATAQVMSMAETGTTVNEQPLVEFGLRVNRDGHEPYEVKIKQVLPRLLLGTVTPGITLSVKVLPDKPQKVGIDWSSPGTTGDPASRIDEGLFAGVTISDTVDTKQFMTTAVPATADVDQMSETGHTVKSPSTGETTEVFAFVLTVHRDGEDPYEAKLLAGVPPEHKGHFGPGGTVPIGINPADRTDVAIDWDRMGREPFGS